MKKVHPSIFLCTQYYSYNNHNLCKKELNPGYREEISVNYEE